MHSRANYVSNNIYLLTNEIVKMETTTNGLSSLGDASFFYNIIQIDPVLVCNDKKKKWLFITIKKNK